LVTDYIYIYIYIYISRRSVKGATINGVTYEGVAEFIYMGTLISNDNSVEKINGKTYFGRQ